MDFEQAYEEVAAAMRSASASKGIGPLDQIVEQLGLIRTEGGPQMTRHAWEKGEGDKVLRVRYRYFDQSQAFSIRPDMNVLNVELVVNGQIVRQEEQRYED